MKRINLLVKRIMDIVCSAVGLFVLLPVLFITGILIKLLMPGPVFFVQERVGKDGKLFKILKFRTMKVDKEAEKAFDSSKDKQRLTVLGSFLRRTKIDELPQLINVFLGDMSLVGPRPTILDQVNHYNKEQRIRLNMRPGMTGLAQVSGNTALTWDERIHYDLEYIRKFSIFLDLMILGKTVLVVIAGEKIFKK